MVSQWWALVSILSVTYGHVPCQHSYGGGCRHNVEPFVPAPVGQVPRCVQNYHGDVTYCETIDRYPEQLISYLVTKSDKNFKSFFIEEKRSDRPYFQYKNINNQHGFGNYHDYQNDTQNIFNGYPDRTYNLPLISLTESPLVHQNRRPIPNVNHGVHGFNRKKRQDDIQLCQIKVEDIFPKAALNTQGEWKYVANMVQTTSVMYKQSVRSEKCMAPDEPCNGICDTPQGFSTTCKQKFVQKRLVALQGTGDNLYVDQFWFPHCCACTINRVEQ